MTQNRNGLRGCGNEMKWNKLIWDDVSSYVVSKQRVPNCCDSQTDILATQQTPLKYQSTERRNVLLILTRINDELYLLWWAVWQWQSKVVQIRVHNRTLKSNPNPTTKQHAIVNIQLNIIKCPTYPDKFIRDNVVAPFVPTSIVTVTLYPLCYRHTTLLNVGSYIQRLWPALDST